MGSGVIIIGSFDHARWRHVFIVVRDDERVRVDGVRVSTATATAAVVDRFAPRTGDGRHGGRGRQPVLGPLVVHRQPVQLSDAFPQESPGGRRRETHGRARFRRIAFRPETVRKLPLTDRVPLHRLAAAPGPTATCCGRFEQVRVQQELTKSSEYLLLSSTLFIFSIRKRQFFFLGIFPRLLLLFHCSHERALSLKIGANVNSFFFR